MTITISITTFLLAFNLVSMALGAAYFYRRLRRPCHLWMTGEYNGMTKRGHIIWHLGGIYRTREEALAVCSEKNHFVTCLELGKQLPEKKEDQPVTEWPLIKAKEAN
jgi:hypothetical protein